MTDQEVFELLQLIERGHKATTEDVDFLATIKKITLKRIEEIPYSIALLAGLEELYVSLDSFDRSRINKLPDSIGNLGCLRRLYLHGTGIRTLPDSIGNLGNLQRLDLRRTSIGALPDSIGNLGNLQVLDLGGTGLRSLPDSIGNLDSLQCLYLGGTGLRSLPDSIANLGNLWRLKLHGTGIRALPDNIGNLSRLRFLDLGNCSIGALPDSIGNLGSLQFLDLRNCSIGALPDSIGNLGSLQRLDLRGTNIVTLPDSIGNLGNLLRLKLHGTGIRALPDSIGNLGNLQRLYLGGTRIVTLPDSIGNLGNLQRLDLRRTSIGALPDSIGNLGSLQTLHLCESSMAVLPDSIGNLSSLQCLNLRGTEIEALPDSIGNLDNLQIIDLRGTRIVTLPDSIGNLDSLQTLDLRGTGIGTLPDSIGNLNSLQTFDLRGTRIVTLPDSIGNLGSLQCLYLGGTGIEKLPDSIGNLNSLQTFDLRGTRIVTLPDSIGNLGSLQCLYLGGTGIEKLPDSIGNLDSLKSLDLSGSRIGTLPESIKKLSKLNTIVLNSLSLSELPECLLSLNLEFNEETTSRHYEESGIYIHNLRLQRQPVSLFYQSRDLIQKYYESEKEGLKESKVIFIGDGGAGKSYTIQRIKNNGELLEKDTDITHDITIERWDNSKRIVDYGGSIDFWDFGGQDIYLSMHRCFMTERSCYVIVLCNRQQGSHRGLMRQARYWLKNIFTFVKDSPILIAVNTWSGQPRDGISLTQLKTEFPELNIVDQIVYNAHDTDTGEFNRLTTRICRMAKDNYSYDLQFPKSWNNIRNRLLKKYCNRNLIAETEYYRICEEEMVSNDGYYDEGIARWLLNWFNDLGYCFNYHDIDENTSGEEYQVLKPQWIIRAMYKIINHKIYWHPVSTTPAIDEMSDALYDSDLYPEGRILKSVVIKLLTDEQESGKPYSKIEAEYIIRILRKFRLAYLLADQGAEELFIPALASDKRHEEFDQIGDELKLKIVYLVRFKYLPDTVMHHLMINCYQNGRRLEKVWRNGFHLQDPFGRLITVEMLNDTEIRIRYYEPEDNNNCYGLHEIRMWLTAIYKDIGIENVRDFIVRENKKPQQTAVISVKALVDAYIANPSMKLFYVQDNDIYQGYPVDELLRGLYGSNYKSLLKNDNQTKTGTATSYRQTSPESLSEEVVINQQLARIVALLQELVDKKGVADSDIVKEAVQDIIKAMEEIHVDSINERLREREQLKELLTAAKDKDETKLRQLLSDTNALSTFISNLVKLGKFGALFV